jgi:hypothetical protein
MKRTVLIILAICSFYVITYGQFESEAAGEILVSKNGHNILPEKGDIGLAIDAVPFLDFIGNLTKINSGGSFNSPLHIQPPEGGIAICIKYFTGAKTAIRARGRVAYTAFTEKSPVTDQTDPLETLYDTRISSNAIIDAGVGIEMRKGDTRMQGIYGIEGTLTVTRGYETAPNYRYRYANEFSSTYPAPESNIWDGAGTTANVGTRPIYQKNAPQYGIGARGFIGAEYFFTPKISIGGELAAQLQIGRSGSSKVKTEYWDAAAGSVERDVTKDKSTSGSMLMLDNVVDAHLFLVLYF